MSKRGGSSGNEEKVQLTNAKQRKTREKIFAHPTPNDMRPDDVKSLLIHMKYDLEYRGGSMVAILKNGDGIVVHMPHGSNKQMKVYSIIEIRKFMTKMKDNP